MSKTPTIKERIAYYRQAAEKISQSHDYHTYHAWSCYALGNVSNDKYPKYDQNSTSSLEEYFPEYYDIIADASSPSIAFCLGLNSDIECYTDANECRIYALLLAADIAEYEYKQAQKRKQIYLGVAKLCEEASEQSTHYLIRKYMYKNASDVFLCNILEDISDMEYPEFELHRPTYQNLTWKPNYPDLSTRIKEQVVSTAEVWWPLGFSTEQLKVTMREKAMVMHMCAAMCD